MAMDNLTSAVLKTLETHINVADYFNKPYRDYMLEDLIEKVKHD